MQKIMKIFENMDFRWISKTFWPNYASLIMYNYMEIWWTKLILYPITFISNLIGMLPRRVAYKKKQKKNI